MLLHKNNWKSCLQYLLELVSDYEHHIIVCLRDIRQALPSYYGETYNSLPQLYRNSFDSFVKSPYSSIYDYEEVSKELYPSNHVNYIDFNRLVNNLCYKGELLPGISSSDENVIISKQNTKKRSYNVDKVEITININKLKSSFFLKNIHYILTRLRLNKLKLMLIRRLKYDKTIILEISNHINEIHQRNLIF
jgi:hypothetical protein